MHRYQICLYHSSGLGQRTWRVLFRDNNADAVDAARRELRRIRNANADLPTLPDRWSLARMDRHSLPRIIAVGRAEDQPSAMEVPS